MWSRKSAMLGSLAVAMYLLGLTLRNSQLVTIAVVIFVFLKGTISDYVLYHESYEKNAHHSNSKPALFD